MAMAEQFTTVQSITQVPDPKAYLAKLLTTIGTGLDAISVRGRDNVNNLNACMTIMGLVMQAMDEIEVIIPGKAEA